MKRLNQAEKLQKKLREKDEAQKKSLAISLPIQEKTKEGVKELLSEELKKPDVASGYYAAVVAEKKDKLEKELQKESTQKQIDETKKLYVCAFQYYKKVMKLLEEGKGREAFQTLNLALQFADRAKSPDLQIILRNIIIKDSLINENFVPALIQAENLDEILNSENIASLASLASVGKAEKLGSTLSRMDMTRTYLYLALCMLYLGNFSKAQQYFEKEQKVVPEKWPDQWHKDLYHDLQKIFSILQSQGRKLLKVENNNNNNNNENNKFSILSKFLTKLEESCLLSIDESDLKKFNELYDNLIYLINFFDIYYTLPSDSEYWLRVSRLPGQVAEIKFKLAESLSKKRNPDFSNTAVEKIIVELLTDALNLARELDNQPLIISSASLLVDFYKTKVEQDKEDKVSREKYDSYLRIKQQQEKYEAELKAQQAEREARRQELERLEKENANQDINDNAENSNQPEAVKLSQDDLYSKGIKLLDNGQISDAEFYLLQAKDGENSVTQLKSYFAIAECQFRAIDSDMNFQCFFDRMNKKISLTEFDEKVKENLQKNKQNLNDINYATSFLKSPENIYITYLLVNQMEGLISYLTKLFEYIENVLFNLEDAYNLLLKIKSKDFQNYEDLVKELQKKITKLITNASLITEVAKNIKEWLKSKHDIIDLLMDNNLWAFKEKPQEPSPLTQIGHKIAILLDSERQVQLTDEFRVKNYSLHIKNLEKQAAQLSKFQQNPKKKRIESQNSELAESNQEASTVQNSNPSNSNDNFSPITKKFERLITRANDLQTATNDNCDNNNNRTEQSTHRGINLLAIENISSDEVDEIVDPETNQTLLHKAVLEKSLAKIMDLCKKQANVNKQDRDGNTPLHLAAKYYDEAYNFFLYIPDADFNIENNEGITPLHYRMMQQPTSSSNQLTQAIPAANITTNNTVEFQEITLKLIQKADSIEQAGVIDETLFALYKQIAKNLLTQESFISAYAYLNKLINLVISYSLGDKVDKAHICDQLNYCIDKIVLEIEQQIKYATDTRKHIYHYHSLVRYLTSQKEYCEKTISFYEQCLAEQLIEADKILMVENRIQEIKQLIPKILAAKSFYDSKISASQNAVNTIEVATTFPSDNPSPEPQDLKKSSKSSETTYSQQLDESKQLLVTKLPAAFNASNVINPKLLKELSKIKFKTKDPETVSVILKQILQEIEVFANGNKEKYQTVLNNCKMNTGESLLHIAAAYGLIPLVNIMLEKGADVNALDNSGHSVVYSSALYGHLDITKTLAEHGANYLLADRWGSSPLHAAASWGHLAVVDYLIKVCGENTNRLDGNNRTAFQLSVMNSRASATAANPVTNFFINGAKAQGNPLPTYVNMKDSKNNTALHLAIMCVKDNFAATCTSIEKLLQAGADINAKNSKDYTPAELVFKFKKLNADDKFKLIKLIVEHSKNKVDLTYCEKHLTAGDLAKLNMENVRGISEKRFEIVRAMQHEAQKRAQMLPKR